MYLVCSCIVRFLALTCIIADDRKLGLEKLHERGIRILEVTVAEAPNQSAAYRAPVPSTIEEFEITANSPVNVRPRFCASKADDDN